MNFEKSRGSPILWVLAYNNPVCNLHYLLKELLALSRYWRLKGWSGERLTSQHGATFLQTSITLFVVLTTTTLILQNFNLQFSQRKYFKFFFRNYLQCLLKVITLNNLVYTLNRVANFLKVSVSVSNFFKILNLILMYQELNMCTISMNCEMIWITVWIWITET